MAMDRTAVEDALGQAAARLVGRGFAKSGVVLSQRIPEQNALVSAVIDTGADTTVQCVWTTLEAAPVGLHGCLYVARHDVGAIFAGPLKWAGALALMNMSLPAVFDEQVRHLGVEVSRVAVRSTDGVPAAALGNGANAYCLDDIALCFGMSLERLMANIEILEKCAESFVLAHSASAKVSRIPWLIKFIANGRLKKDQKDAASRHLRGERAIIKAGY